MTAVLERPAGTNGAAPPTPPPAPAPRRRVAPDGETGTSIALAVLTLASVLCMRRLFTDWSYFWPVAAAAVGVHAVAWVCRRTKLPGITVVVGPIVVLALTIGWFEIPETTYFGIPTTDTYHSAVDLLRGALNDFHNVVAPVKVTPGFIIASILGAVIVATLADWAAFRMRAVIEACIPSFGLFVFVAALATSTGRTLSIAVEVAAVIGYLLVHQVTHQRRVTGWVANRSAGAGAAVLRAGLVLALIGVIAAVFIGPNVPGADGKAIVAWRSRTSDLRSTRSTVSPFVDIRGRLVENQTVQVFTVETPVRSYWRLTALDTFNGNIWASNESYKSVGSKLPTGGRAVPGAQVRQSFTISTLDSIWLPAAYEPVRIEGLKDVSYNEDSASLISSKDTTNGLKYTASSVLPQYSAAELGAAGPIDPTRLARYLQLPRVSGRVRTLAQQIARGKTTEYDKALALQNYLRNSPFRYSTNVSLTHSESAIETFLFNTKTGYCEQFAGSYAVLARTLGLPTRIAVGFTAGNANGTTYEVLNEHAHAWPEVYFPNVGWVAFEPTPGRAIPGATYTGVQESADAGGGDGSTTTTVPDTTETTLVGGATTTTLPDQSTTIPNASKKADRSGLVTVLLVVALLMVLAALWLIGVPAMRRHLRDRRRAGAQSAAARVLVYWQEANDILASAGAGRRPHETFREHARRAAPQARLDRDVGSALLSLAGDATTANYGSNEVPSDVVDRAEAAAAAVEEAVLAQRNRRQRVLWSIDPRPLVTSRR